MLEGKGFRDVLEQLKTQYDLVIFDGAPLNLVADSFTLGARLDGVISVIRAGDVSRGTVTRVREQLRQVHAHLLGFVLNAAQVSNTGYFKENYRSFYRYAGDSRRSGQSVRFALRHLSRTPRRRRITVMLPASYRGHSGPVRAMGHRPSLAKEPAIPTLAH